MTAAVDPAVLKKTQEVLGKFVKKPPLTDKLLGKPPFRFLHDVINAVITNSGFLAGLYTDEELSSDNIKDKDAKIAFLQKCIDATSIATGESLSARPSKIVAGHDVDKTNEWLQALGRAISQKTDSAEAVQQVLSGAKPEKGKKEKPEKEKSDKKPERGKKEVAANKGSIRARDPKPKTDPKPKEPNPNANKNLRSSNNNVPSKPNTNPSTTRGPKPSKDPRNAPAGKASIKPSDDKGSPDKSSKEKEKEKSGRKERGRDEKESKKSSKGRRESGKEDKDEKGRRKAKSDASPEKGRSKSRAASRAGQVKDPGKENSPPEEKIEDGEVIANGDAGEDETEAEPVLGLSRPASTKPDDSQGPEEEDLADPPDEGVDTQDVPPDEGVDTQDVPPEEDSQVPNDSLLLIDDDNANIEETEVAVELGGPESLLQLDGEAPQENEGQNEEETPVISSLAEESNNNIDPAILKAMAPGHDVIDPNEANDQLEAPATLDPPDSGVGSLESPKHPPQSERQSPAEGAPAKPGPQPLRAMEPFGDEASAPPFPLAHTPMPNEEEQGAYGGREKSARPRTGRRSARPPSARPAPPKIRERKEIPKEELPRPATGKPVANVILSSDAADNDDDDDNFMVEETKPAIADELITPDPVLGNTAVATAAAAAGEDGEGAGLLVAQILETKKELEDGRRNAFSPETPGHRRVQIEQSQLSDANRRKERELIQKDVQKLSGSIQSLTRSVNPLAKMLDYLQEDLDSMHKELETWRDENRQLAQTLKREQSMTEQALEPLRAQLAELESAVQEQRDKLSAVKSNILRNNEKVSRLMAGINLNM